MNFPANPTLNQTYTYGTRTWKWDGTTWNLQRGAASLATVATSGSFTDLVNKPTTLSGYGITDGSLPTQTGNTGKYLTTNGTITSWATVDALPSQTGNSGKYLTTNGTTASWATVSGGSATPGGSTTQVQYNSSGAFTGSANLTFNGTGLTSGYFIPSSSSEPAVGINLTSADTIGFTSASQGVGMRFKTFQIGSTGLYVNQLAIGSGINTDSSPALYVRRSNIGVSASYSTSTNDLSLYTYNGNIPYALGSLTYTPAGYNPSLSVCHVGGAFYTLSQGNTFTTNPNGAFQQFPNISVYAEAQGQVGNTNYTCFYGSAVPAYYSCTAYYARVSNAVTSGQGFGYKVDLGTHPFSGGSIGFYSRIVSGQGGSYDNVTGWVHKDETSSGSTYAARFERGGNQVGNISLSTSATTYSTSSDPRLKNITGPITANEATNFVMALQPKKGTWKTDGSYFQGFVSTDYETLDPKSVHGVTGATETLGNIVDQTGKILNEDVVDPGSLLPEGSHWEQTQVKDVYQTLEYGSAAWCANMTAHAQYLQNTIEQLVVRITQLENRL
jgi:hypothetical protein